jgi:hypothetical protein
MQDNATVFGESMKRVTSKGFVDSTGAEQEVDVIICATGYVDTAILAHRPPSVATNPTLRSFNTSYVPRFPIVAH